MYRRLLNNDDYDLYLLHVFTNFKLFFWNQDCTKASSLEWCLTLCQSISQYCLCCLKINKQTKKLKEKKITLTISCQNCKFVAVSVTLTAALMERKCTVVAFGRQQNLVSLILCKCMYEQNCIYFFK